MSDISFSQLMDRSRLDRLEHEIALIAQDMLHSYANKENEVHEAFLQAGCFYYEKQLFWCLDGYSDLVLSETQRLLRIARHADGAWHPEQSPFIEEMAAGGGKAQASIDEIEAEIVAQASRFEEETYQPLDIGRALARVGLSFAPAGFIELEYKVRSSLRESRAERQRAFLDECLGEDRYPSGAGAQN